LITFSNFRSLDPDTIDLTRELVDNADRQRSSFMSFVNMWMAFNGWMESVTEATTDAAMITAVAEHRRVSGSYEELMERSSEFRRRVLTFSEMWPVVNVRDLRKKLGYDAFHRCSRQELLRECAREDVKFQPVAWTNGGIPTWPQLLRTIYAIRCNMFHGSKSPQNSRDRDLVRHSDRILKIFIEQTGCFDWYD
jgi:hypothetical protein